ncbi:MAG: DUF1570 domain-containing protein [Colwellia sp.]
MKSYTRQGCFYSLILFLSTLVFATRAADITAFNKAYSQHQQLISEKKYQKALPLAQQSYELAKAIFDPLNSNRLIVTDNYALNLQMTHNVTMARAVFIELLALYQQKYGKHAIELLPLLTDITTLNTQLKDDIDEDETKEYAIRRYKLYLRHYSDDFIKQFADPQLPTTRHAKNTAGKLASHFDKDFAIYESDHWSIIYPPKELKFVKNKMAKLMEKTYHNNISFLVSMGLRNKPLKEKMTAVYFENREDYISYIKAITGDSYGSKNSGGIFYHKARSIFLFGYGKGKNSKVKRPKVHTVVHEVSHQVLYATGFQSIHYVQPRWLTEGLAASFEYNTGKLSFGPHTNNYAFRRVFPIKKRVEDSSLISLKDLVTFDGDDEAFNSAQNQSDIYALGTMLVRFLYTYYPDEFKTYLKILSKSRTTLYERAKFGRNVRLKQFKKAFGQPELMQDQFSAFIAKVIKETDVAYAEYKAKKRVKRKSQKNETSA